MLIRLHRGSYSDSIYTSKEIDDSKQAILEYLKEKEVLLAETIKDIQVRFYANTPDRLWSQDYIITCEQGVLGFCDQPVFK